MGKDTTRRSELGSGRLNTSPDTFGASLASSFEPAERSSP